MNSHLYTRWHYRYGSVLIHPSHKAMQHTEMHINRHIPLSRPRLQFPFLLCLPVQLLQGASSFWTQNTSRWSPGKWTLTFRSSVAFCFHELDVFEWLCNLAVIVVMYLQTCYTAAVEALYSCWHSEHFTGYSCASGETNDCEALCKE